LKQELLPVAYPDRSTFALVMRSVTILDLLASLLVPQQQEKAVQLSSLPADPMTDSLVLVETSSLNPELGLLQEKLF